MNFITRLKTLFSGDFEPEHLRRSKLGKRAAKELLRKHGLKFLAANLGIRASEKLKPFGVHIETAVVDYAEALKIFDGRTTVIEAVRCFARMPISGLAVFDCATNGTIYYLPGTTGWNTTIADHPTALWVP